MNSNDSFWVDTQKKHYQKVKLASQNAEIERHDV